jgi:mRNA interferase RelE/StbE
MSQYEIAFQPSVEKDLRKLSSENRDRVLVRIAGLRNEPLPSQVVKLTGTENLYRVRVGDYRIVYEVELEIKQVLIHYIRHRREVYRDL